MMGDIDDIEYECNEAIINDVLISTDLTASAYYLPDLREEVTRQLLSQNIGESILNGFVDSIVGKTLLYFQTHSKCFPQ